MRFPTKFCAVYFAFCKFRADGTRPARLPDRLQFRLPEAGAFDRSTGSIELRLASQVVDPEREEAAAGAPADRESPAGGRRVGPGAAESGEGDPILGATLNALKPAAEGVEIERRVAETLQRSLLPRLPVVPGLRLAARYRPGSAETRIGGDWYDAIPLRGGNVGIAIGDVVGRGVKAAARMAHLQSALRAYALESLRPALVLERMNSFVLEGEQGGMVTLLYAVVDPDGHTVQVASAGHPPPLLLDPGGPPTFAEAPAGSPLGVARYSVLRGERDDARPLVHRAALHRWPRRGPRAAPRPGPGGASEHHGGRAARARGAVPTPCSIRSTCGSASATTSRCSPFS